MKIMFHFAMKTVKTVIIIILTIALVVVVANLIVVQSTNPKVYNTVESKIPSVDAIVVMGAAVNADYTPSSILQDRLDTAVTLYFAGVAPKMIMTGYDEKTGYNEVGVMKNYAIAQGVPSEDIFCDHAGQNTYDSMYRLKNVFLAESAVCVTQDFHIARCVYDACAFGVNAYGVTAAYNHYSSNAVNQNYYLFREFFARTHDCIKCIFKPASSVQGEPVPLTQSGDVTNG